MSSDHQDTEEINQIDSKPSSSNSSTFECKGQCFNRTQTKSNKTESYPNFCSKPARKPIEKKNNVVGIFYQKYNEASKESINSKSVTQSDTHNPKVSKSYNVCSTKKINKSQVTQNVRKDDQTCKTNFHLHQPTTNRQSSYSKNKSNYCSNQNKNKNQPEKNVTSNKKKIKNKSYTINLEIIKELKIASNYKGTCDFTKIADMLTSIKDVDCKVLIDLIHLVNNISFNESHQKLEILHFIFQKQYLDAILNYMQQKTRELTKSDEGKEQCEGFFKEFLELSLLAIKHLPASSLDYLKHTLVFTKTILSRLEGRINISHQHIDFDEMAIQIEEKTKTEELTKEEVSLSDIEHMQNMSILPTKEDLFGKPPELKENIVEGAYKNTDHYLTVQFTLLHEDFIAPLREGILDFLSPSSNAVKGNTQVAVYHHVRIKHASIDSGKFGHVVQLDRKIKWEIVTRFFIFGSLLLFTTDYFKSFIIGTVININPQSKTIMVKLQTNYIKVCKDIYSEEFIMGVSKVFFEPYYHVLSVLQEMARDEFPMKKYIVEAHSDSQPPAYINQLGLDKYTIFGQTSVDIFNPCWSQLTAVKLNPSQQQAFQAALTNEIVAIQGPPGTGKTFLGLQIVSALLDNVANDTPILVVCYKNHALDQFLEGVLNKTKKIIRIGGRSANESLKKFNLRDLRGRYGYHDHELFLTTLASCYFKTENQMDSLKKHGILSVQNILPYVASTKLKKELMSINFEYWLIEGAYIDEGYEQVYAEEFCNDNENKNGYIKKSGLTVDLNCDDSTSQPKYHDNGDQWVKNEVYNKNGTILESIPNSQNNDSEFGNVDENCGVKSIEKTVSGFQLIRSCPQEDIFTEPNPGIRGDYVTSDEGCSNYSQTCYDLDVDLGTSSVTSEKLRNGMECPVSGEKFLFSKESKQRFDEMYIDDYTNIYDEAAKEVQEEMQNNMYGNQGKGETSSYSQNIVPFFTITVRSLEEMNRVNQSRIHNLLQDSNLNDDEKNIWHTVWVMDMEDITRKIFFLKKMMGKKPSFQSNEIEKIYALGEKFGVWSLTNSQRWLLYHSWLNSLEEDMKKELVELEESIRFGEQRLDKARSVADLQVLQRAQVVGVTTTGAAKNRSTLNKLGAKIVVIEEAAEVLESHIVTSLSNKCQHLILIGDHKQLKPNPAVYKLCKKYNFDVSLFERMVRNGLSCHTLDVQHRMRPEFASLIVPAIYPHLMNHPSTENRPDIAGIHNNLYFIDHNHPEEKLFETASHMNKFEARFVIELAQYLLLQGYSTDDITILATYSGQVKQIMKMRDQTKVIMRDLRISTVDDFQGEENKIIILSLVRSNEEGNIGFLKIENRVCVALSRARDGLYIIGNMDCLTESSQIWPLVKEKLIVHKALGETLSVYCQNHKETVTLVKTGGMFKDMPEGGCSRMCETKLSCGHVCKYHCHPRDQQHIDLYTCSMPCERTCKLKHLCSRLCGQKCGPCKWPVEYTLPCGHPIKAACSCDPATLKCRVILPFVPACGHESTKFCFETVLDLAMRKCRHVCDKAMQCGHSCTQICGHNGFCDPNQCTIEVEKTLDCEHKVKINCNDGAEETVCYEMVEKTLDCGHSRSVPCHFSKYPEICRVEVEKVLKCKHTELVACAESIDEVMCSTVVSRKLSCGHEIFADCGLSLSTLVCQEQCTKLLECGHFCKKWCSSKCICTAVVDKKLRCGHQVKATCGEECDKRNCQELVVCEVKPACGHGPVMAPCYLNNMGPEVSTLKVQEFCKAVCNAQLQCGHNCLGECRNCLAESFHALCNQPCKIIFPCGHRCPKKCYEDCGVCNERCLNKCSHRKCDRLCGEPCDWCQELCELMCTHNRCHRPCFTFCDRNSCSLPCPLLQACGHPCLGFCGERCPPLCLQCMPQHPFATWRNVNARLILLEDCGHVVEAASMDAFFGRNKFRIVKCPIVFCQTPIITTKRYHKEVTEAFFNIMTLKRQMQGNGNDESPMKNQNQERAFHRYPFHQSIQNRGISRHLDSNTPMGEPYQLCQNEVYQRNPHGNNPREPCQASQNGAVSRNPHGNSLKERPYQSSQNGGTSRNPHGNSQKGRPYQSSQNGAVSRNPHGNSPKERPYQSSQNRGTSRNPHSNSQKGRPYQSSQNRGKKSIQKLSKRED